MRIRKIQELLGAELICGGARLGDEVIMAFAADMMSDVLACADDIHVLLTGLINPQVIRTADMMDIGMILFVRGKKPTQVMIDMAMQLGMVVMVSKYKMYTTSGILYEAGLMRLTD